MVECRSIMHGRLRGNASTVVAQVGRAVTQRTRFLITASLPSEGWGWRQQWLAGPLWKRGIKKLANDSASSSSSAPASRHQK